MREYKFRAWESDKMYYQVRCGGIFDGIPTAPTVWNEEHGDWLNLTGQPHTIIMQYTGIEDKNGKEIYDRDIVKIYPREGYGYLTMDSEMGVIEYVHGRYMIRGSSGNNPYFLIYAEVEVIGNVFENYDLLETK